MRDFSYASSLDARAISNANYSQGSEPISINTVECIGTETNILECNLDMDATGCGHIGAAAVQCVGKLVTPILILKLTLLLVSLFCIMHHVS